MLAELLKQSASGVVFAGITDAAATEAAYGQAGLGADISLSITGSSPRSGELNAVQVDAKVTFLLEASASRSPCEAVLRIGGIDLVVTARRRPFHDLADFAKLGLDPNNAKIVVVKSGYLSPEPAPIANPSLMALSPGVVDQFVERLPRVRKSVPTYPFDRDFAFTPAAVPSKRAPFA